MRDKTLISSVQVYTFFPPSPHLFFFLSSMQKTAFSSHIQFYIEGHLVSVFPNYFFLIIIFSLNLKELLAFRFPGNFVQMTDSAYLWNQVKKILVFSWHEKNALEELNKSMVQLKPWICYFPVKYTITLYFKINNLEIKSFRYSQWSVLQVLRHRWRSEWNKISIPNWRLC